MQLSERATCSSLHEDWLPLKAVGEIVSSGMVRTLHLSWLLLDRPPWPFLLFFPSTETMVPTLVLSSLLVSPQTSEMGHQPSLGDVLEALLATSHICILYFSCVGVEEEEAPDIDIYHCPNCEKTHGKSTCKYSLGSMLTSGHGAVSHPSPILTLLTCPV